MKFDCQEDTNFRELLIKVLKRAGIEKEWLNLKCSGGCMWILSVRLPSGGEATIQESAGASNLVRLPDDFPWRIATSRNEIFLSMMTGDSSKRLEIFSEEADISERGFKMILTSLLRGGAEVTFATSESEAYSRESIEWIKQKYKEWVESCNGNSKNVNPALRAQILKRIQQQGAVSKSLSKRMVILDHPYPCLEALEIELAMS